MAEVVAVHRGDIKGELDRARSRSADLETELTETRRQVVMLEGLLAFDPKSRSDVSTGGANLTLHEAMAKVLRAAPERMMRAGDIAKEIERRGLYRMRDGRPVEATQIHARVSHNPQLFTKEGTFIKLIPSTTA